MNLLEWRTKKKLNQQQAGDELGLKQATVSRIERGTLFPSPARAKQIVERSGGEITHEDLNAAYLANSGAAA